MLRRLALALLLASSASVAVVALAAPQAATSASINPLGDVGAPPADARRDARPFDAQRDGIVPDVAGDVLRGEIGADAPAADAAVPACITWWTEARYRPYGYDHIVHLKSVCAKASDCTVSTNVNPEVKRVLVPANASVEVYTYLLSPAREFSAYVQCKLRN